MSDFFSYLCTDKADRYASIHLLYTDHYINRTIIEGVYSDFKEAQKDMRKSFESSKEIWLGTDTSQYHEVIIECHTASAMIYGIDEDYRERGMTWAIEADTVI